MLMMNTVLTVACFLAQAPMAQDRGAPRQEDHRVIIEYYQPEKAPSYELQRAMQQLDPPASGRPGPGGAIIAVPYYTVFGETLLVKHREEEMPATLETLRRLDQAYVGESEWQGPTLEIFHYQVRHVPLNSVLSGLRGAFQQPAQQSGRGAPPSISTIEDRGMVIFRGSPDDVKEVSALIETLDVPLPQLLITVYIIEGTSEDKADFRVPADLARDLSALVPYEAFNIVSMGILPSDTVSPMEMEAMFSDQVGEFKLQMYPQAFDPETGALTIGKVEFRASSNKNGVRNHRQFTTSTSLRRGQYTVLGAVGADPIFVVAEMRDPSKMKPR